MKTYTLANHADRIVSSLLSALLESDCTARFTELIARMKSFEQRKYLNAVIAAVVERYFASDVVSKDDVPILASKTVSGAASLLSNMTKDNDVLKEHLVTLLTRSTIPSLDDSLAARRSVMAVLAKEEGQYM